MQLGDHDHLNNLAFGLRTQPVGSLSIRTSSPPALLTLDT